jgi:hypothetical protein
VFRNFGKNADYPKPLFLKKWQQGSSILEHKPLHQKLMATKVLLFFDRRLADDTIRKFIATNQGNLEIINSFICR